MTSFLFSLILLATNIWNAYFRLHEQRSYWFDCVTYSHSPSSFPDDWLHSTYNWPKGIIEGLTNSLVCCCPIFFMVMWIVIFLCYSFRWLIFEKPLCLMSWDDCYRYNLYFVYNILYTQFFCHRKTQLNNNVGLW